MPTTLRWPAGLPQKIPFTSELGRQDNVIRTEIDAGPIKTRRRFTAVSRVIDISSGMVLDSEQLGEFDAFYDIVTQSGAASFMWLDPITGWGDVEMRFMDVPKTEFVVAGRYETRQHRVKFMLEVLPG